MLYNIPQYQQALILPLIMMYQITHMTTFIDNWGLSYINKRLDFILFYFMKTNKWYKKHKYLGFSILIFTIFTILFTFRAQSEYERNY